MPSRSLLPRIQPAADGVVVDGKRFGELGEGIALCREPHGMSVLAVTRAAARLVHLGQSDLLFIG